MVELGRESPYTPSGYTLTELPTSATAFVEGLPLEGRQYIGASGLLLSSYDRELAVMIYDALTLEARSGSHIIIGKQQLLCMFSVETRKVPNSLPVDS